MVEFAIVLMVAHRRPNQKRDVPELPFFKKTSDKIETEKPQTNRLVEVPELKINQVSTYSCTEKIDFISLIVFTSAYLTFNVIYFANLNN